MAEIIGYDAAVYFGSVVPGVSDCDFHANAWSLDVDVDLHDTTDFCTEGWREQIAGLKSWSGSMELRMDSAHQIQPSDIGEEATLKLYLDSTNYYEGKAIFSGYGASVSVDDLESQTVEFTGASDLFLKP